MPGANCECKGSVHLTAGLNGGTDGMCKTKVRSAQIDIAPRRTRLVGTESLAGQLGRLRCSVRRPRREDRDRPGLEQPTLSRV